MLCAPNGDAPQILCACDDDRLIAALPLVRRKRMLLGLATAHTPRFDLVGDAAALPALWRELRSDATWDRLELPYVPTDSPLATTLPHLARADGFLAVLSPGPRSPWFPLDKFEAALGSKFRGNLRRRAKKLGDVRFELIDRYDRAALDEGLALEAAGWKGKAGTGTAIACDPTLMRFYHATARVFAKRRQLALSFLRANGKRIAFHYALTDGRAYYLLKPGFDPAFASFGPGQLHVLHAATFADRQGLQEFDFLGWDMPWKLEWTSDVHAHATVRVYRPLLAQRLTYAAKEVIRPRLFELGRHLARHPAREVLAARASAIVSALSRRLAE
jgi:hypothetical protein